MGNVHSHDNWTERMKAYDERLEGQFRWAPGDGMAGAWLMNPAGHKIAAVQFEYAAGIVEALNTPEGRRAYARVVIDG